MSHVPALDGLRGLAVAGVLLFHTGHLPGGFLGVDLFFVLSGFLITGLLLREARTTGRIAVVPFWGRRLRRLFPALAVVLLTVTTAVWALRWLGHSVADRDMVSMTMSDGLWAQLNLVNWHLLAQDASYWDAHGASRVFEHLWSIAVEEQFYLGWPLVIGAIAWMAARFRSPRRGGVDASALAAAVAISGVSLVLMAALFDPADPTRVYTGTDTRAFSLLLGAAAATAPARRAFQHIVEASRSVATWSIGILTAAILMSWMLVDGTSTPGLFTGGLFVHATVCAVLLGLCAAVSTPHEQNGPPGRLPIPVRMLHATPLTRLGGISYSLYLWHWPVIVLLPAQDYPALPYWLHSALVLGVSVVLATASTRLVEEPIRFQARWTRGRTGLIVFLTVSTALLAMWFTLPTPAAPSIDVGDL